MDADIQILDNEMQQAYQNEVANVRVEPSPKNNSTEIMLNFLGEITKGTLLGSGINTVKDIYEVGHGNSFERINALENLGIQAGVTAGIMLSDGLVGAVAEGLTPTLSRVASRLGFFGGGGAEGLVNINNAKLMGKYDAYNPGILSNRKASTFLGQKYQTYQLQEDTVLYRAGNSKNHLGEFFTTTKPTGELQVRIDQAVLPKWPDGGASIIDTGYAISMPKGTIVHMGEIAPQGNIFLGGTQQIFIEKPWLIPDVKLVDRFALQQELLWNQMARK